MAAKAVVLAGLAAVCCAQSTFTPLRPPSLPLAVRSPYLSTWQSAGSDGGNGGYLPGQWPTFWHGATTGWTGYIRVDNITYTWMGKPNATAQQNYYVVQTGYEYTSTQSIFTLDVVGQIEMLVTFLSPVLPDTLLEMSLPYSYMDVSVRSLDGKNHDVQVYSDISAEWVSGDRDATAQWSYGTSNSNPMPKAAPPVASPATVAPGPLTTYATHTSAAHPVISPTHGSQPIHAPGQGFRPQGVTQPPFNAIKIPKAQAPVNARTGGVAYHRVWRQEQLEFHETAEQAEWGYWYYTTNNVKDLTHQQGADDVVRSQFINNGFLANTQDNQYRTISDHAPVFGFAVNLGSVAKAQKHTTFQISLHQENAIQFEAAEGNISVPSLYTNYFDADTPAVEYFYRQYARILADSKAVDSKVSTDSSGAAGDAYAAITSLAVRQAFGAVVYTNTPSEPWVFLKEISSDGDAQTVDVIFPMHPIFVYFNPNIIRYMLQPLFINQEAGYWPYAFSMHDLGIFPNATGYNNVDVPVENQQVEECGNMLAMALAYAQRTGDNAYLAEHYSILRQWNEYLVNETLIPELQTSTDDFLGQVVNDTNLAIKGIIGIEAMAQIANRTGHSKDGENFTDIAHDYIKKWQGYGIAYNEHPPHSTAQYGRNQTYSLLYNIYPDKMLGLQLVPQSVYDMQSNFYPTKFNRYGIPLRNTPPDGQHLTTTKVDWEHWVAAIASNSTRNQFIQIIRTWLDQTPTNTGFTDWFDVNSGDFAGGFTTRPVVGGVFATLALQGAPKSGYVAPMS